MIILSKFSHSKFYQNFISIFSVLLLFGCQTQLKLDNLLVSSTDTKKISANLPPKIELDEVVSQKTNLSSSNNINFIGHSNQVVGLDFSPDGRWLATASYDKTVRVWNIASKSPPHILRGHEQGVNAVAISPEGKLLASGSWDHNVIIWDYTSGKKLNTFKRHRSGVATLAFTPDGNTLLSGDYKGIINVWDIKKNRWLGSLLGHKLGIQTIVVSADGMTAASAGADKKIHMWDLTSLSEVQKITGHTGLIKALIFTPDGKSLLSGGTENSVFMWNLENGEQVGTFGGNLHSVNSLSISSDGRRLLISDHDLVNIWDIKTGKELSSMRHHKGIVSSAKFSPNNNLVASASLDNSVKLWEPSFGIITSKIGVLETKDRMIKLSGTIKDTDNLSTVTLDGKSLTLTSDGAFTSSNALLIGANKYQIVAVDAEGNRSEYNLTVNRLEPQSVRGAFPSLQMPELAVTPNPNRVAIIIGIETYINVPDAQYAENDSRVFYDYATSVLAIPPNQINLIYGKNATRAKILKTFSNWLKSFSANPNTEVFIFFSGHGLSKPDGTDAFFLPVDGDPSLLSDTAISRQRIIKDLENINARSVILFLDTCYSGLSRNGEAIIPGQRPIVIATSDWTGLPSNMSILSAAAKDEISISIDENKHGLFSYFLMRALDGEADNAASGNKDGELSLSEIRDFIGPRIKQEAASRGQNQTPQLIGPPSTIVGKWK